MVKKLLFNKIYGDGLKKISYGFNEHRRLGLVYHVRVDSLTNVYEMHELAEQIENDLIDEYGMFDRGEEFKEYCSEQRFDTSKCGPSCFCKIHNKMYLNWFKEQFPKVDISGGASNWFEV